MRSIYVVPQIDLDNQSKEIPNSGGARQSVLSPPGEVTGMIHDDAKTLLEVMERGRKQSNNGPCLGWRNSSSEYNWINYSEVIERAQKVSSGLVHIGMKPGQSTFVGIYAQNCVEWVLTEYACYNQSTISVPLYDTLGPKACSFIINQTEMNLVVCDNEDKVKSLLADAKNTPSLKELVVFSNVSEEVKKLAKEQEIQIYIFKDVENLGKEHSYPIVPPKSDDLFTICYTSGTTGDPKGVMLTHGNLISAACGVNLHLGDYAPTTNDVFISFLPLAHMMERTNQVAFYMNGGSVGFWQGDIKLLMDDLKALKPTMMAAVPRVLNRIYDKVQARANASTVKRLLLTLALNRKMAEIRRSIIRTDSIWDKLVFKQIREGLGGQLRLLVSGAAPLSEDVLQFVRCSFGCMVTEGYGQTETAAPCAIGTPGDLTPGQVGPPLPSCHFKLVDVPEMEYFAYRGQGEICIRGASVFKGYYKLPEKTAETIDNEGWLHTGDIGMWLPNGSLKIVDRKKHIFKLSQGEYVAPEKIENVYQASKYVNQIFVWGESLYNYVVGIVVPDEEVLRPWCEERNIVGDWKNICNNLVVKNAILADITALGRTAGLKSFEQVKDIYLHPEPFTIENGFLTPTSKVKRIECRKHFTDRIQDMYKRHP